MNVLGKIRQATDSTAAKLVFAAIVLVFVFWGVGRTRGPKAQVIAEVNGVIIKDTEFHRAMRAARNQERSALDEDQTNALARQVISQLIDREVLVQRAQELGIEVSNEELARYVLQYDAFKDDDGKFSEEIYERVLKRSGTTKGRFEMQARRDLMVEKLVDMAIAAVHVSDAAVKREYVRNNTKLKLQYVRLPYSAMLARVPVTDADVDAFLKDHPDEVKAAYDGEMRARYHIPRKAQLSTILLRTDLTGGKVGDEDLIARLEKIRAQALQGADFAELARKWSEDLSAVNGGDLGKLSEEQMDPAVADAVFKTDVGGVTDIVQTGRGFQILKVVAKSAAQTVPFDQAKREIAQTLLAKRQVEPVTDKAAEEILTQWKKSPDQLPEELLKKYAVIVQISEEMPLSRIELAGLERVPGLEEALSTVTSPQVIDRVLPIPQGRLVVRVAEYTPADMKGFDAQKGLVRARLLYEKQSEFVGGWQKDLIARANIKQYYNP